MDYGEHSTALQLLKLSGDIKILQFAPSSVMAVWVLSLVQLFCSSTNSTICSDTEEGIRQCECLGALALSLCTFLHLSAQYIFRL